MNVFELFAKITLDTKEYTSGLRGAASKMSDLGGKISGAAKTVAKVTGAALGTASAAVGKLTQKAVSSYADYEQLVGGVETLFGTGGKDIQEYADFVGKSVDDVRKEYMNLEKAQSEVLNNAAKAYTTAGMSQNEYMETVTSFAASLTSSLGGDTVKAADVADRAIRDMADNANKMGTSIEMIQNAYNGFAKQNYTMLDNLKLGYGGTKSEMERLIEDASKMTDVQKKLGIEVEAGDMSFGNIANAISVVQTKLGITGTTADEAAGTIAGSAASAKAAWENLITGLADKNADLGGLIDTFVTSVGTAAENMVPTISKALEGVGTLIEKLAPVIADELPHLVKTILPALVESAATVIAAIAEALPDLLPVIWDSLKTAIRTIGKELSDAFPELSFIFDNLEDAIKGIIAVIAGFKVIGFIASVVKAIGGVIDIIKVTATAVKGLFGLIAANPIGAILTAVALLIAGLVALYHNSETFRKAVQKFGDMVYGVFKEAVEIVKNFIGNWVDGFNTILDAAGAVLEAVKQFFVNAWNNIKAVWSTVADFFVGIWEGVKNAFAAVGDFFRTVFEGALNAVKEVWNGIIGFFKAIWEGIKSVFNAYINFIGNFFQAELQIVKTVWNTITSFFSGIWEGIKSVFSAVSGTLGGFFSSAWENIKSAFSSVGDFFSDVWETIKSAFDISKALDWGKDLIENFIDGVKSAWKNLKGAVSDVAGGIKDFLGFSEPKKGPLSNFHTYAPDMMELFASGIKDNAYVVQNQLDKSLDFDIPTQSVDFTSSGLGNISSTVASTNKAAAASGGEKQPLTIVVQLSSGLEIARQVVDDINKLQRFSGKALV